MEPYRCPVCGSVDLRLFQRFGQFFVHCDHCGVETEYVMNRRAADDEVSASRNRKAVGR